MNLIPQLFRRNTNHNDPQITQLVDFDTATKKKILLLGVVREGTRTVVKGMATSSDGIDHIKELFQENEVFRQRFRVISKILDLASLVFDIPLIAPDELEKLILRSYPVELQLSIDPAIAGVIDPVTARLGRFVFMRVNGTSLHVLVHGGAREAVTNWLGHSENREALLQAAGLPSTTKLAPHWVSGSADLIERIISQHCRVRSATLQKARFEQDNRLITKSLNRKYEDVLGASSPTSKRQIDDPIADLVELVMATAFDRRIADVVFRFDDDLCAIQTKFGVNGQYEIHSTHSLRDPKLYDPFLNFFGKLTNVDLEYGFPKEAHATFKFVHKGKNYNFDGRVTFFPKAYAGNVIRYKIVVRIFLPQKEMLTLDDIGFHPAIRELVDYQVLNYRSGLVVAVGLVNSGKNTLILALIDAMLKLNPALEIQSIENPLETLCTFMDQAKLPDGADAAMFLGSAFRVAANVFYVPEINSRQMAEMVFGMVRSGHLVFSTAHCEKPQDLVDRFTELGLPSSQVASALQTVIATKLVPVLCPHCSVPQIRDDFSDQDRHYLLSLAPLLKKFGWLQQNEDGGWVFSDNFAPRTSSPATKTCPHCDDKGISTRTGLHEVWFGKNQEADIRKGLSTLALRQNTINFYGGLYGEGGYYTFAQAALGLLACGQLSLTHFRQFLGAIDPATEGLLEYDYASFVEILRKRKIDDLHRKMGLAEEDPAPAATQSNATQGAPVSPAPMTAPPWFDPAQSVIDAETLPETEDPMGSNQSEHLSVGDNDPASVM